MNADKQPRFYRKNIMLVDSFTSWSMLQVPEELEGTDENGLVDGILPPQPKGRFPTKTPPCVLSCGAEAAQCFPYIAGTGIPLERIQLCDFRFCRNRSPFRVGCSIESSEQDVFRESWYRRRIFRCQVTSKWDLSENHNIRVRFFFACFEISQGDFS